MIRYKVVSTPDQTAYVILDKAAGGWCALPPEEGGEPEILEWPSQAAAEAWLFRCRQVWGRWERTGPPTRKHYAPAGWSFMNDQPSPWA